ncbi:ABC transporter permease [Bosea sp. (in: a-proteobacteria)]|uniref:ABC transporter permease n=1 Tax=Bosea sp. (in: a-proteobacteria) TaxID=1871050 RepID=UPI0027350C83|nr:ABC transporter permease [Bosea sp. (in: a-proteobacteria)]MDP3254668.1 ABC transporter permease [Bosea sp. (in: a-proteobacteria)]
MTSLDTLPAPAAPPRRHGRGMSPVVRLSAGFLVAVVGVALLADWLAPLHYTTQNLAARLKPPLFESGGVTHWLGTDQLGRDILSRLIFAIRTSILIAVAGTLIGAVFGTLLGFVAARCRGLVDQTIMMAVDAQAAIPALFLALTMLAFFGNNILLFIVLVSIDGWDRYTRLARGLVVSEQESDYINAVEGLGASTARVMLGHLLPNIVAALVVQATLNFPGTILLETSLSFLGLGVQPPETSLGLMLGEGRRYLLNAWWIAVFPGLAIFLTTLSMSLFGDWLRDRFDPTTQRN